MLTYYQFFAIIIPIALLSGACANVAAMPTGPSVRSSVSATFDEPAVLAQDFPSLTGQWRASGTTAFRNLDTGNTLNWGGCSGAFIINDQDDQRFIGLLNTEGRGWNSDRFCTTSVTFNGELLERDGSVARAWLEGNSRNWPRPAVSPACEFISAGDGIWTGSATSDAIRLQVSDRLRCAANVDGGLFGMPMASFERTVSLVFERW
jgi:hypothetical protein